MSNEIKRIVIGTWVQLQIVLDRNEKLENEGYQRWEFDQICHVDEVNEYLKAFDEKWWSSVFFNIKDVDNKTVYLQRQITEGNLWKLSLYFDPELAKSIKNILSAQQLFYHSMKILN